MFGAFWAPDSEFVEEFLNLSKIFQFYLLDEKDIHLRHHIHRLQQILREISVLKEERIESVMKIIIEVFQRTQVGQNMLDDIFMVVKNIVKRTSLEVAAGHKVKILTERESPQAVYLSDTTEFREVVLHTHHARTCENYLQSRIIVVAESKRPCSSLAV